MGLGFLQNSWWTDPNWGMAAMAMPAIWQLSGYVMALFLAGFRGIPDELREAARIDGCQRLEALPARALPAADPGRACPPLIIIGHMSMKMFDLITSSSGANTYNTAGARHHDVGQSCSRSDYAKLRPPSRTILLVLVALVIVPYLIYTTPGRRSADDHRNRHRPPIQVAHAAGPPAPRHRRHRLSAALRYACCCCSSSWC